MHYATYASTKEKVIEYAQEKMTNGHDVVKSIKLGQMIDMSAEEPARRIPQRQIPSRELMNRKDLTSNMKQN